MTLKTMINYKQLKEFLEAKGFLTYEEDEILCFKNQYNFEFCISQGKEDSNLIYLDSNIQNLSGIPNFIREWNNGDNLYDYIISNVYPISVNIKGPCATQIIKDQIPDLVIKILKEKDIEYEFHEDAEITYIKSSPYRSTYEKINKFKLFSFMYNEIKYGIILKQFNSLYFVRFINNTNKVFYEYNSYSFSPIYKEATEFVNSALENFLECIKREKI